MDQLTLVPLRDDEVSNYRELGLVQPSNPHPTPQPPTEAHDGSKHAPVALPLYPFIDSPPCV